MIRWLRPGSFRKKSLSLEYVSLSLMYSWNLSGRHRETIVARRPVVPEEAVRVCMIQPEDIAAFVLLAAQLPC
jgi:hypothetical protein